MVKDMMSKCLVTVDLELLYKKFDNINKDLADIKNNIYSVLNKNYDKNINHIHTLLSKTDVNATTLNNHIMSKKRVF